MSDMKHQSVDELRSLINWCSGKREELKTSWELEERRIEEIKERISKNRKVYGNIGEKERWARIWLARKEVGGFNE